MSVEKKLTVEQIYWDSEAVQGVWLATQEDEDGRNSSVLLVGDGEALENLEMAVGDGRGGWHGVLHLPHGSEQYVAAALKAEGQ